MATFPPEDPLSSELKQWQIAPPRTPQFRTEVWRRIESAGRPSNWTKFARAHPTAVTAMLAAAVLAGAWGGRTEAHEQLAADRQAIAASYVHSLDARWMRHP